MKSPPPPHDCEQSFRQNFNLIVTQLMDVGYLSLIAQQTWRRAAAHMLIKPQLQLGELIPIVVPPPPLSPTHTHTHTTIQPPSYCTDACLIIPHQISHP